MAVARDLAKEQQALKIFVANNKKLPSSQDDWNKLHALAYPTPATMPSEFQNAIQQGSPSAGLTPPAPTPNPNAPLQPGPSGAGPDGTLSQTVAGSNLPQLSAAVGAADQTAQSLTHPNDAINVLQQAIRAKNGLDNPNSQNIGTNEAFNQLGLSGMGALGASIATQHQALESDATRFDNTIKTMSGHYADEALAAKTQYDHAFQQWQTEANRLQGIQDNLTAHAQAIDTIQKQNDAAKSLEDYKNKFGRSAADVTSGLSGGLEQNPTTGAWQQKQNTTVTSPSGDTYDVGRYAVNNDGTPNMDHIAAMNSAYQKMGKLNGPEDITKFIQQYYPSSPITADMVTKASTKYGIDWETILATMAAETQMGTDGSKGSKMKNFGNVGNTNTAMADGKPVAMNDAQAGVDAVAKTLSNPIYKRNQTAGSEGATGQADYKQYGLLAKTDFNPSSEVDKTASKYLDAYLKSPNGSYPTAAQILGSARSSNTTLFRQASERASDLYFKATGASLPDLADMKNLKTIRSANDKILLSNQLQSNIVTKNFDLAIDGQITGNVNKNAPVINKLLNPFREAIGDPQVAAALVSNGTISQEFANLLAIKNAGGTTVSDKEMAAELIPFGTSVEQQKAIVERIKTEAVNIQSAVKTQNGELWKRIDPLEQSTENPNRQAKVTSNTEGQAPIDENHFRSILAGQKMADGSALKQSDIDQLITEAKTLTSQGKSQADITAAINYALGH